jgi:Permease MlaE
LARTPSSKLFVLPMNCAKSSGMHQFGYRSAPLILTAGVAIGVVLSMHTRASLERFGAEVMIPAALAVALIRETGPLITGLLVAGRVGAGIGAEIGAMKVTEQIDALEANAVDAFKYLAVTRIIALMICPRRHCQVNARGDTRLPCCYVAESVKPRPGAVDRRRGTPARAQDVKLACLERYIHSRSSSGRLVTGRCT